MCTALAVDDPDDDVCDVVAVPAVLAPVVPEGELTVGLLELVHAALVNANVRRLMVRTGVRMIERRNRLLGIARDMGLSVGEAVC